MIGLFEGKLKERLPVVLGEVMELLRKPSDRVEDVREKEAIYNRVLDLLRPFKEVADVWTSTWFGNEMDEGAYETMLLKLADTPEVWEEEVRSQAWFQKAQEEACHRHFFHWELEFPEVFYRETGGRKENPGFDVVIGNPPYLFLSGRGSPVRQLENEGRYRESEALRHEIEYLSEQFSSSSEGCKDYYKWFIDESARLARCQGRVSLIVSSTWIAYPKFRDVRTILAVQNQLIELIDIGGEVFPDPTVLASVFVMQKSEGLRQTEKIKYSDLKHYPRAKLEGGDLSHIVRAHSSSIVINEEIEFEIYRSPVASRLIVEWADDLKMTPFVIHEGEHGLNIDRGHLTQHPGPNDVPVVMDWEMARYLPPPIAFIAKSVAGASIHALHQGERLLLRKTGDTIVTAPPLDYRDGLAHQNVYVVRMVSPEIRPEYILSLLNSRLLTHIYQNSPFGQPGRVQAQFRIDFLYRLPIRRIAFTTPKEERARLVEEGKRLYFGTLKKLGGEAQ